MSRSVKIGKVKTNGSRGVPEEVKLLTVAVELLLKEKRMRPMVVDTIIREGRETSAVGRLIVGCGDSGSGGKISVSYELKNLSRGELYMVASAALSLYKQALDAAEDKQKEE
ncbi:MAG: hypothetical protein U0N15_05725 [Bifidobacterium choerinum]